MSLVERCLLRARACPRVARPHHAQRPRRLRHLRRHYTLRRLFILNHLLLLLPPQLGLLLGADRGTAVRMGQLLRGYDCVPHINPQDSRQQF